MLYGQLEYSFAEPFASQLASNVEFKSWVLKHTKFSIYAENSRLLYEEMKAKRSVAASTWWRSYFTEKCRCSGCSGNETDILAVFEAAQGLRFAIHFEVKQPTDIFPAHKTQAINYRLRAECWTKSAPRTVLPHSCADTVLLCSALKLDSYGDNPSQFGSVITFEEMDKYFPVVFPSIENLILKERK